MCRYRSEMVWGAIVVGASSELSTSVRPQHIVFSYLCAAVRSGLRLAVLFRIGKGVIMNKKLTLEECIELNEQDWRAFHAYMRDELAQKIRPTATLEELLESVNINFGDSDETSGTKHN